MAGKIERYSQVSKILYEDDLGDCGSPMPDEYDEEAIFIVNRLSCKVTGSTAHVQQEAFSYLSNVLYGTFVLYFGADLIPKRNDICWIKAAERLTPLFRWKRTD